MKRRFVALLFCAFSPFLLTGGSGAGGALTARPCAAVSAHLPAIGEGSPATPFAAEELGEFTLCAYCTERYAHICGGSDTTRSGDPVCAGVTVAVDPEVIPLGSTLYIEGIGFRKAQDTGSAIRGQTIDLAVGRHSDALSFGVQHRRVWLVQ